MAMPQPGTAATLHPFAPKMPPTLTFASEVPSEAATVFIAAPASVLKVCTRSSPQRALVSHALRASACVTHWHPSHARQDGSAFGLPALQALVGPAGLQTLLALGKRARCLPTAAPPSAFSGFARVLRAAGVLCGHGG